MALRFMIPLQRLRMVPSTGARAFVCMPMHAHAQAPLHTAMRTHTHFVRVAEVILASGARGPGFNSRNGPMKFEQVVHLSCFTGAPQKRAHSDTCKLTSSGSGSALGREGALLHAGRACLLSLSLSLERGILNRVHQPGIEPGSHRWQRCILPLDH